jgi:hypothetical protein
MGRDRMLNDHQKRILEYLKEEAWMRGKNLSTKELIAQLTEVLVWELMDSEMHLKLNKMSYAEALSLVKNDISPSAIAGYNILLNKELKARQKDPLWCIGIPTIPEIPPGMIGILLSYWRTLTDNKKPGGDLSRRLTIRRIQWMARLFNYFQDVWESKYSQEYQGKKAGTPEYDNIKIGVLSRIADIYAAREEISKETGELFNTRDLDTHFFVKGDLNINYALSPDFEKQLEDLKNTPAWKNL